MSYILDALRKADAQRERDPSRGIHARPLGTLPGLARPGPKPWQWGALALGVLAVAVVAWIVLMPAAPQVAMVAPAAVAPTAVVQAPAPVVLPPPAPVIPAPVVAAAPSPAPAPATPILKKREAPAVSGAPAPAPAEARIFPASELPSDLPKLAISGGVYSDNPAQRMLIVNGQVVNEGAQLAPDMVLEQIRAKSAVLRVRGLRYSVSY